MVGSIKLNSVFVIDSSFLISTMFPDEKISTEHLEYLNGFKKGKVSFRSCDLLKYEIFNCLKSAVLQKRISIRQSEMIERGFGMMNIEYQNINFQKTFELSLKHNLSFYDASYLYLAKVNKCKLLTLDKKLAEIAK